MKYILSRDKLFETKDSPRLMKVSGYFDTDIIVLPQAYRKELMESLSKAMQKAMLDLFTPFNDIIDISCRPKLKGIHDQIASISTRLYLNNDGFLSDMVNDLGENNHVTIQTDALPLNKEKGILPNIGYDAIFRDKSVGTYFMQLTKENQSKIAVNHEIFKGVTVKEVHNPSGKKGHYGQTFRYLTVELSGDILNWAYRLDPSEVIQKLANSLAEYRTDRLKRGNLFPQFLAKEFDALPSTPTGEGLSMNAEVIKETFAKIYQDGGHGERPKNNYNIEMKARLKLKAHTNEAINSAVEKWRVETIPKLYSRLGSTPSARWI